MPTFYSPNGNPEIWPEKPEKYFTPQEWPAARPLIAAKAEALARAEAIRRELAALDLASIRALRDIDNGTATQADYDRLRTICEKAGKLRVELKELTEDANA